MTLKLGKRPATYDRRDLLFAAYRAPGALLPPRPRTFGHEAVVPAKRWGMLGNDRVGDCVFAGAAHETMLWTGETGRATAFTDVGVVSDYSAVTGYTPADPSSDQGTDVRAALTYRRKTGVLDAHGTRHKIGAFVALEPGNRTALLDALYLFGAVGIGIQFPSSAMDQFNAGKLWSVVHGAHLDGGHYIPLVARRTHLECVTWGQIQGMTDAFYAKYCDEAWAIVSPDMLVAGKTLEGFDLAQLTADLTALA